MSPALGGGPRAAPPSTARSAGAALALAAVAALHTLVYVHTGFWVLAILAVVLLAARVARADTGPAQAAWFGWAFGTSWLAAGTWWLFISMHRYGGLPAPLAALAVLALAAALSLYLALAMALFARWRRGHVLADAGLFAGLWLAAELARGVIFTGFPWLASGYAQVDSPLAALAPWIGVYGVGAVVAFIAALTASIRARRVWPLAPALAILALPAITGPGRFSAPGSTLQVTLLQGNVAQDEKFAAEHMPQALAWTAAALRDARGDLVIAPETAVPLLPAQLDEIAPGFWLALRAHFAGGGQAALIGLPLGDYGSGYTNSVAGLSRATAAAGADYRYDKLHLVPFGEFIPPGFRWFTDLMQIPLGDFDRGVANPPSFPVRGERVAPNICYEDLFGEELARRFVDPALAPTLFANVSNIGWFGDTAAIGQHLNISRFRTLEFQRPMLRATNTGATAIIDHRGGVVAQLPPHTRGVLTGSVQGRRGTTPFAAWAARFGLWPLWALAAAAALAAARLPRPRRLPAP